MQQPDQMFASNYAASDASCPSPFTRRTPISSVPGSRHASLGPADFAQLPTESLIEYLRQYQATQQLNAATVPTIVSDTGGGTPRVLDTMHEGVIYGPNHSSSGTPSPNPSGMMSPTKKLSKPMIEKRRRDRINRCLQTLKRLVIDSKRFPMTNASKSRVEKADILEVTVKYLENIESESARQFQAGYSTCLVDVLATIQDLAADRPAQEEQESTLFQELHKRLTLLQQNQQPPGTNDSSSSMDQPLNMRDLLDELNGIKSRSGSINDASTLEGCISRNSIEDLMIANYESDYDDRQSSKSKHFKECNLNSQEYSAVLQHINGGGAGSGHNSQQSSSNSSVIRHTNELNSSINQVKQEAMKLMIPSVPLQIIPTAREQPSENITDLTPTNSAPMPRRLHHVGSSPFIFDAAREVQGNERNSSNFDPIWRPWGFS